MTADSPSILESAMRITLAGALEDQGYRVTALKGGNDALKYVQESPPDVVMADLRLPDGSGLDILESLKEVSPESAFILMTGHASLETAVEALNEGAYAYISKPFNMDEVHTVIRNALRQQRLLLENRRLVESLQQSNKELATEVAERQRAEQALARQAQELARSNAELEQFAYIASHDLQEPVRMVMSYTQLLANRYRGKLDADADEFIAYAVDGGRRMQGLINDLLALSRVGTQGRAFAPTACEAVLQRSLANLRTAVGENGAVVTHEPLPTVLADGSQLGQIFQNLIGNAIKYHGNTPPTVHVKAERREGEWLFSVRDNGIGIDPQYAQRIFVIFQRLHTSAEYPGSGVGLAICQKIVERHGGAIWAESQQGQGATFYFTLSDMPAGTTGAAGAEQP